MALSDANVELVESEPIPLPLFLSIRSSSKSLSFPAKNNPFSLPKCSTCFPLDPINEVNFLPPTEVRLTLRPFFFQFLSSREIVRPKVKVFFPASINTRNPGSASGLFPCTIANATGPFAISSNSLISSPNLSLILPNISSSNPFSIFTRNDFISALFQSPPITPDFKFLSAEA